MLDTNVWISGLQFAKSSGTPTRAIQKAVSQDLIATCDEIQAEIARVLIEKFAWRPERVRDAFDSLLVRSIRVKIDGTLKVCRDPHDDKFLECAVRSKAGLLVAGDKDLLVLSHIERTRIITPAEYLRTNVK